MADPEQDDSYYHPGGVPVSPQARKFGYEFPVYVSDNVWSICCVSADIKRIRNTSLDRRVSELLTYCYEGMMRKLAVEDGFLWYNFKVWFWSRSRPNSKKKQRMRLAARLFLDPSTKGPWLYIFAPNVDSIDALKKGEAPDESSADNPDVPEVGNYVDFGPELESADAIFGGTPRGGNDGIISDPESSENIS